MKTNSLLALYPNLAKEYSLKNTISSDVVAAQSNKKAIWIGACGHEWEAPVQKRTIRGDGCPFCAGRALLQGFNDFATCYPELAKYFSSKSPYAANEITKRSTKEVIVFCSECLKEKKTQAYKITSSKCRSCSSKNFKIKYERSLAYLNPKIANLIAEKSPFSGEEISLYSLKELLWNCDFGFPHTYSMKVHNKTFGGQKCPICANRRLEPGVNDFLTTHPELAKKVASDSILKANEVIATGSKKLLFECERGHKWEAFVKNVTRGSWCPKCSYIDNSSKGEKELASFLEEKYEIVKHERSMLEGLEIDLWIPALQIGIEYNGNYWHGLPEGREKDSRKKNVAKNKNITLLTVWDEDWHVMQDKIKEILNSEIEKEWLPQPTVTEFSLWLKIKLGLCEKVDFSIEGEKIKVKNFIIHFPTTEQLEERNYCLKKAKEAEEENIECITVLPWHDWQKMFKFIENKLTANQKLYARKLKYQSLPKKDFTEKSYKEIKNFIDENHVLGYNGRNINHVTWLSDDLGNIMMVALWAVKRSFKLKADEKPEEIELVRLASLKNKVIVGGASKIVTNRIKELSPEITKIVTFSDYDFSQGNVYKTLGFELVEKPKAQRNFVHFAQLKNNRAWQVKATSLYLAGSDRLLQNFPGYKPVGMKCLCLNEFHAKAECLPTNQEIVKSYGFKEVFDCGYKKWQLLLER